jgi:DNA-binding protein H-NS
MARPSYETIKKQIARLEAQAKAIEASRDDSKARSVERVRALMKKLGVEMADLERVGAPKGRRGVKAGAAGKAPAAKAAKKGGSRPPVAPKYRDPESGATWSGRGRTPVWLATHLAQGRSREAFAIAGAATPSAD